MRRVLATVAVLVALAGANLSARGDGLDLGSPEAKRIRAIIAWRRAVWHVSREDFERARIELEKAIDVDPSPDATIQCLIGLTYLRLDRLQEADIYLEKARKLAPDLPGIAFTDALKVTATKATDLADTERRINVALEKFHDYFEVLAGYPKDKPFAAELRFLGHVYRARVESQVQQERDHAVSDLNAAIELAKANGWPPATEVVTLLAKVHESLDQFDAAKRVVKEAMARDPGDAVNYYNYGQLVVASREYPAAWKWFDASLARKSDLAEARLRLAFIAWHLADPSAMRPELEAVRSIRVSRSDAGNPADSKTVADMDSGYGIYWKLVGEDRSNAGDDAGAVEAFQNAVRLFKSALEKEPDCVTALNMLLQLSTRIPMPDKELEDLKRRLHELDERHKRDIDAYKSTFC